MPSVSEKKYEKENEITFEDLSDEMEPEDEFSEAWDDIGTEIYDVSKTQKRVDEILDKASNLPDYTELLSAEDKEIDKKLTERIAQDLAKLNSKKTKEMLDELSQMSKMCEAKVAALSEYLDRAQEVKGIKIDGITEEVTKKNLEIKSEFLKGNLSSQESIDLQAANFSEYLKTCAEIDQLSKEEIENAKEELEKVKETLGHIEKAGKSISTKYNELQSETKLIDTDKIKETAKVSADKIKGKGKEEFNKAKEAVNFRLEQANQRSDEVHMRASKQIHDTVAKLHSLMSGLKERLDHTLDALGKGKDKVIAAFHDAGRYAFHANRMVMDITIQNHSQALENHMSKYKNLVDCRDALNEAVDKYAQISPMLKSIHERHRSNRSTLVNMFFNAALHDVSNRIDHEQKAIGREGKDLVKHIEGYMKSYHKLQDRYYAKNETKKQPQQSLDAQIKSIQTKQAKDALETAVNLYKSVSNKDVLTICGADFSRDDKSGKILINGEIASKNKIEEFILGVGSKKVIAEAHDTMNNIYQVTAAQTGRDTKDDLLL